MGSLTIGWETVDGARRQRRRWVTGKSKSAVLARLDELRSTLGRGGDIDRSELTTAAFLADWLAAATPSLAAATGGQYRQVVRDYIVPRVGAIKLSKLSVRDVSRMLSDMAAPAPSRPTGYSTTARRLARSILRRALRSAEADGLVPRNVAALADPVRADVAAKRGMSVDQAKAFLAAVRGHRDEALFVVALTCGLRPAETLGLAWDAIDLDAGKLRVMRGLKRVPGAGLVLEGAKTKTSQRTLYLADGTVETLRRHRDLMRLEASVAGSSWPVNLFGVDLVFRSPVGTPLDPKRMWSLVDAAARAAGLGHWSPHELRHSAASILMAQGLPLKLIQEFLGHSSIPGHGRRVRAYGGGLEGGRRPDYERGYAVNV